MNLHLYLQFEFTSLPIMNWDIFARKFRYFDLIQSYEIDDDDD